MVFRVHEEFLDHPKLDGLEEEPAIWGAVISVWLAAGLDCRGRLTDGRITYARLRRITPYDATVLDNVVTLLVERGLWERDGEDAYVFHDWDDVQDVKLEVQDRRLKQRLKKRSQRERVRALLATVSPGDNRVDNPGDSPRDTPRDSWVGKGRVGEVNSSSRSLPLLAASSEITPAEHDQVGIGLSAVRAFAGPLLNIAHGFEYEKWRPDWDWIARQPNAEVSMVIATLASHPEWIRNWRRLSPGHIRKWWAAYAAGELPAYTANDNGKRNGRRASEVGSPEDFREEP